LLRLIETEREMTAIVTSLAGLLRPVKVRIAHKSAVPKLLLVGTHYRNPRFPFREAEVSQVRFPSGSLGTGTTGALIFEQHE
jgi:hypothetical protein